MTARYEPADGADTAGARVSHYEAIGGAGTVRTAVERFYVLVLEDSELAPYFDGVDMPRIKRHLAALLTHVLGGPGTYEGRDLAAAHTGLQITEAHYRKVVDYLAAVLWTLGAGEQVVMAVGLSLARLQNQIVAAPGVDAEA